VAVDLDLNVHEIEELPGKHIMLAGARYSLAELLGEGGVKFVFPIKNVRSGLILFVAKFYKYRPESEEVRRLAETLRWTMFELVPAGLALYTEVHQAAGAFLELQPYGVTDNAEYCAALMQRASVLHGAGNWSRATVAYDDVLSHNPHHSIAILNKGVAEFNLGHLDEAFRCVSRSIEIEPNFTRAYHALSNMLLGMQQPVQACEPLERTLNRYRADPQTWLRLLEIATEWDLVEASAEALNEVYRLGRHPDGRPPQPFVRFEIEVTASHARWRRNRELLQVAMVAQQSAHWSEALSRCEEAAQCSKNNSVARLNAFICRYHLGQGESIAKAVLEGLYRWADMELVGALPLAMLCAHAAGMHEDVRRIALWIGGTFEHHADVPAVPVAVSADGGFMETRSGRAIIDVLRMAGEGGPDAERRQIGRLLKLYEARERAFV
jgi:tetratricopeptide (TPR) repeat protein